MIDPFSDELIWLNDVPKHIPAGRCSPAAVTGWARLGVNGVVLETVKIGGRRYTTKAALADFFRACSQRDVAVRTQQEKRSQAMADRLAERGLVRKRRQTQRASA